MANLFLLVKFYKVDVDKNSEASAAAEISCMPTFKFYKNGEVVHTIEGADISGVASAVSTHK